MSLIKQTISKFFQPLGKKYRFWTLSASVIIGILLYIGMDIMLAELVRQNSHPINMLAAELLLEHGPEYIRASREHAEMIDKYYNRHLEQRRLASMLSALFPKLSPEKSLASVREALGKVTEEEKAENTIWQAGLMSNQLYLLGERFPRSPIKWFKSEDLPGWLTTDLERAFETFHKQVDELERAQMLDLKAAETECRSACIESRRAILLLSLARLGYKNEEKKIERFQNDLMQAHQLALRFAERARIEKDEGRWDIFYNRAKNMNLRAKVVTAMLDNDMDTARDLLREEIDRALKASAKEKANATT